MNRRQFVQGVFVSGASAATLSIPSISQAALMSNETSFENVSHALVDRRFTLTQGYVEKLKLAGKTVFDTQADSMTLFYRQPAAFSKARNESIVGLTTYSDFEIIQDLLMQQGMALQQEVVRQSGSGLPTEKVTLVEWEFV